MLAEFGVSFVAERRAVNADAAVAAASTLGFPVVVKLSGEGIAHKTERGLVRLGLGDVEAVRRGSRRPCLEQPGPTMVTSSYSSPR